MARAVASAPPPEPAPAPPLLVVRDLAVAYGSGEQARRVVLDVSFALARGEALGLVGESGCGKSQTTLAVLRLLPRGGRISAGQVLFEGSDLCTAPERRMRQVRGRGIALVSQDALSALNPAMTVGAQMAEPLVRYEGLGRRAARERCVELLERVGIPGARMRLSSYPHELSGGMRQRVLIAMAISCEPKVLIADEPTTALDVTVQAQILRLIDRLRHELGMALVLITHDLGVVAGITDQLAIMYAGRIVETAPTAAVFAAPRHPYTRALLGAIPRLDTAVEERLRPIPGLPPDAAQAVPGCPFHPRCEDVQPICRERLPALEDLPPTSGHRASCWVARADPGFARPASGGRPRASQPRPAPAAEGGIVVEALRVHFPIRSGLLRRRVGTVRAVDGVSFSIPAGTTVGLVGESGSGKSTTGRAILGLAPPTGGRVVCFGQSQDELLRTRTKLPRLGQMVFQDPYASLNPKMTVGATLGEVLRVHRLAAGGEITARTESLLSSVGLRPQTARSHPHELSGGQRQRVAIARALAIEPRFMVLDEVVSSLDVSIQGQIINLLRDLQSERRLTYLFIAHDLSVVRHVSHRVVVMYRGKIMEVAPRERLFDAPHHPYTHALLAAVPVPDPQIERARRRIEAGTETPDPADPPPGCRFQRACPFAAQVCREVEPELEPVGSDHVVACHRWASDDVRAALATSIRGAAVA